MKYIIYIILLVLLTLSVVADINYNETGNFNNQYRDSSSFFQSLNVTTIIKSRSISDPVQTPLVNDLDNDGINEIIVIDGNAFKLFATKNLDILPGFTNLNSSGTQFFITFDIDNDNFTEIITVDDATGIIDIIEFNGTDVFSQNSFIIGDNFTSGEVMLKCAGVNDCIVVYTALKEAPTGSAFPMLFAKFFNSTFLGEELFIINSNYLDTTGVSTSAICFPKIRHIAVGDNDKDGITEYIFTAMNVITNKDDEDIHVIYLETDGTDISIDFIFNETSSGEFGATLEGCDEFEYGSTFTSPLVAELDGDPNSGLEIIIGYMVTTTEFNLRKYNGKTHQSGVLDRFPTFQDAEGLLVSNIMKMNAMDDPNGNANEFCVAGYSASATFLFSPCNSGEACLDLLCGSLLNTVNGENEVEYGFELTDTYNLSSEYNKWNTIAHAAQQSSNDVPNIDELVNAYGVFDLNIDSCTAGAFCDLNRIFAFTDPITNGTVISADVEQVGRDDFLYLTDTNIFYIDDDFSNTPAFISGYIIDPCLNGTWKVNGTLSVQVTVNDINDGNKVNSEVTLYRGLAFEQFQNDTFKDIGTTFSFSFLLNESVGSSTLRLAGFDNQESQTRDNIDLSFSVAANGLEQGDCQTVVTIGVPGVEPETLAESFGVESDNIITTGLLNFDETVGIGLTLIWILIMITVAVVLIRNPELDPQSKLYGIALVETLLIVFGTILGFLSIAIMITISFIFLVILGLWLRSFVLGSRT